MGMMGGDWDGGYQSELGVSSWYLLLTGTADTHTVNDKNGLMTLPTYDDFLNLPVITHL